MQTGTTTPLHAWYASAHPCASTTKGIPSETGGGTKPVFDNRLTNGSSMVCNRFISGTRSALHLSNPKPGHTKDTSGRGAQRSGRAGSRKIECQQNYSPGKQTSIVLSGGSKTRRFNISRDVRTSEIQCRPTEEPNQRLTSGLSALYQRFISGARSALCFCLPTSGAMPFGL